MSSVLIGRFFTTSTTQEAPHYSIGKCQLLLFQGAACILLQNTTDSGKSCLHFLDKFTKIFIDLFR